MERRCSCGSSDGQARGNHPARVYSGEGSGVRFAPGALKNAATAPLKSSMPCIAVSRCSSDGLPPGALAQGGPPCAEASVFAKASPDGSEGRPTLARRRTVPRVQLTERTWPLSFSYARAIQNPVLKKWAENTKANVSADYPIHRPFPL